MSPGGNATGINSFIAEVVAKRLALLHQPVPNAVRVGVLVNPANAPGTETTLRDVEVAARAIGLQIQVLNATTIGEIDAAFASLAHDRPDALFIGVDGYFTERRVQITTLAARNRIPATYPIRDPVVAGGLMSYGTDTRTVIVKLASMPAKSSTAPTLPTCQSCSRPSSSSSSTSRPPRPSALL